MDFPDRERFLELNEVVLQACRSDARERYLTAWDFYTELLLVSDGKSVKRLRLLERRFAAAKRIATVAGAISLITLLVGYQIYRGWRAAADALQRHVGEDIAYGNRALESGDLLASLHISLTRSASIREMPPPSEHTACELAQSLANVRNSRTCGRKGKKWILRNSVRTEARF